jgi:hypothetical protein
MVLKKNNILKDRFFDYFDFIKMFNAKNLRCKYGI